MPMSEISRSPADIGNILRNARRAQQLSQQDLARRAFLALRCRGFARIDFRLDANGRPHVLELNTLPGLQKNYSDFPNVAQAGGISYEELIQRLVDLATKDRGAGV